MKNSNNNMKFWALLEVLPDNRVKIKKAQKLKNINQFSSKWERINARNLARDLSRSELVIN